MTEKVSPVGSTARAARERRYANDPEYARLWNAQKATQAARRPRQTEAQFQFALRNYLRLMNWRVYHTKFSIGSDRGFPDLVAVRAGRCCFIELKTETGKISEAQAEWGELLAGVGGTVEYYLIRGDDAGWQFIEQAFR